eukprot:TRINITY_DN29539_c0_g1_i1.p1 TRINITY_DN29539_c0_g1~~TRINITY_DN29539_c0_g1_i1.p1  ORF type:complete len:1557 (+),score=400.03 TRINITY_DN29539_c0_g1_i1:100-4770(+)
MARTAGFASAGLPRPVGTRFIGDGHSVGPTSVQSRPAGRTVESLQLQAEEFAEPQQHIPDGPAAPAVEDPQRLIDACEREAAACLQASQSAAAAELLDRAVCLRLRTLGPSHPSLVASAEALTRASNHAASAEMKTSGEGMTTGLAQAVQRLQRTLALLAEVGGAASTGSGAPASLAPCLNLTLGNLAALQQRLGTPGSREAALLCLKEAAALNGLPYADGAATQLSLCALLSQLGKHGEAEVHASEAVKLWEADIMELSSLRSGSTAEAAAAVLREKVSALAVAYNNLAVQREFLGQASDCVALYEKAVVLAEGHMDADSPLLARLRESHRNALQSLAERRRKAAGPGALPEHAGHQARRPPAGSQPSLQHSGRSAISAANRLVERQRGRAPPSGTFYGSDADAVRPARLDVSTRTLSNELADLLRPGAAQLNEAVAAAGPPRVAWSTTGSDVVVGSSAAVAAALVAESAQGGGASGSSGAVMRPQLGRRPRSLDPLAAVEEERRRAASCGAPQPWRRSQSKEPQDTGCSRGGDAFGAGQLQRGGSASSRSGAAGRVSSASNRRTQNTASAPAAEPEASDRRPCPEGLGSRQRSAAFGSAEAREASAHEDRQAKSFARRSRGSREAAAVRIQTAYVDHRSRSAQSTPRSVEPDLERTRRNRDDQVLHVHAGSAPLAAAADEFANARSLHGNRPPWLSAPSEAAQPPVLPQRPGERSGDGQALNGRPPRDGLASHPAFAANDGGIGQSPLVRARTQGASDSIIEPSLAVPSLRMLCDRSRAALPPAAPTARPARREEMLERRPSVPLLDAALPHVAMRSEQPPRQLPPKPLSVQIEASGVAARVPDLRSAEPKAAAAGPSGSTCQRQDPVPAQGENAPPKKLTAPHALAASAVTMNAKVRHKAAFTIQAAWWRHQCKQRWQLATLLQSTLRARLERQSLRGRMEQAAQAKLQKKAQAAAAKASAESSRAATATAYAKTTLEADASVLPPGEKEVPARQACLGRSTEDVSDQEDSEESFVAERRRMKESSSKRQLTEGERRERGRSAREDSEARKGKQLETAKATAEAPSRSKSKEDQKAPPVESPTLQQVEEQDQAMPEPEPEETGKSKEDEPDAEEESPKVSSPREEQHPQKPSAAPQPEPKAADLPADANQSPAKSRCSDAAKTNDLAEDMPSPISKQEDSPQREPPQQSDCKGEDTNAIPDEPLRMDAGVEHQKEAVLPSSDAAEAMQHADADDKPPQASTEASEGPPKPETEDSDSHTAAMQEACGTTGAAIEHTEECVSGEKETCGDNPPQEQVQSSSKGEEADLHRQPECTDRTAEPSETDAREPAVASTEEGQRPAATKDSASLAEAQDADAAAAPAASPVQAAAAAGGVTAVEEASAATQSMPAAASSERTPAEAEAAPTAAPSAVEPSRTGGEAGNSSDVAAVASVQEKAAADPDAEVAAMLAAAEVAAPWACRDCGFLNEVSPEVCVLCDAPRSQAPSAPAVTASCQKDGNVRSATGSGDRAQVAVTKSRAEAANTAVKRGGIHAPTSAFAGRSRGGDLQVRGLAR